MTIQTWLKKNKIDLPNKAQGQLGNVVVNIWRMSGLPAQSKKKVFDEQMQATYMASDFCPEFWDKYGDNILMLIKLSGKTP